MRYLTLTSDSSNFEYFCMDKIVKFKWNISQDFSNISYVGISSLILNGFKPTKTERYLKISTNIITRTIANPKRNILNLRIPKNSSVAQFQLNMSKYFSMNHPTHAFFSHHPRFGKIFISANHEIGVTQTDEIFFIFEELELKDLSRPNICVNLSLIHG